MHHEINRHANYRESGQNLCKNSAAHFKSQFPGKPNGCGAGERGEKTQTRKPIAKKMSGGPGDERDQRRLIDISAIEVLAAGEVIKFVAKNSIAASRKQVKN